MGQCVRRGSENAETGLSRRRRLTMVVASRLRKQRLFATALLVGAAFWALGSPVYGQGFMVKPMRLEVTPRAGQALELQISVRNTTNTPNSVLVSAAELVQSEQGGFVPLSLVQEKEKVDTSRMRSCLAWLSVGPDTLDIPPMEDRSVNVRLKVPFGVRGTYSACVTVRTKPPRPEPRKIPIVVHFVIPVIVTVQGSPARENISLTDIGLEYVEATEANPATTQVYMRVNNQGETYARLAGKVALMYQTRGRWRVLSNVAVRGCPSIPGFAIKLTGDTKRRLPSGTYRLSANLVVNGRSKTRMEKEVEFAGDPALTTIAADVTLDITPDEIVIKGVPGNRQMSVLSVKNISDEAVQIACAAAIPPELRGVAMGAVTGDDFVCAGWVQISPASLTLPAGQRRNFKMEVAIPAQGVTQPNYYAHLIILASYPDGQSAGETTKMIWVQNRKAQSEAKAEPIKMTVAWQEEDKHVITAQFGNVGNIDFSPAGYATLATPVGAVVTSVELETAMERVLPLGTPTFSAVIDMAKVEPGFYLLTSTMQYAGKETETTLPIQVEEKEGRKIVTVVEKIPEQPQPSTEEATPK